MRLVLPLPVHPTFQRTHAMAQPNYQFEKRRRDLEKQAKKKEKLQRKLEAAKNPNPPEIIELATEGEAPAKTE
jgi:hypothetical protein